MLHKPEYITRLAPTPSGYLHLGNILNFLLIQHWAKQLPGKILLRIDDLDQERVQPKYIDYIFEVLEKLGITWDLGPKNAQDMAQWSQLQRQALYDSLLEELVQSGRVYACDCSRAQLQQRGETHYQGHCRHRNIPLDQAEVAWRFIVDDVNIDFLEKENKRSIPHLYQHVGDPVVRRKDGIAAYHVASLADDLFYKITHVVRGGDLLYSTAFQVYLAQCIGKEDFSAVSFWHHPLIENAQGEKISKSAGSQLDKPEFVKVEQIFNTFQTWLIAIGG